MAAQQLQVDILAPARLISRGKATQVQAPGIEGYLGVLPGHTAYVTELGIGELGVEGDSKEDYFVSGGYLEVADDKVTVLVDVAEKVADIDLERAEKARLRALDFLQRADDPNVDIARAQAALARAQGRILAARNA